MKNTEGVVFYKQLIINDYSKTKRPFAKTKGR